MYLSKRIQILLIPVTSLMKVLDNISAIFLSKSKVHYW